MWNNAYIDHLILRESLTTSALKASVTGECFDEGFFDAGHCETVG